MLGYKGTYHIITTLHTPNSPKKASNPCVAKSTVCSSFRADPAKLFFSTDKGKLRSAPAKLLFSRAYKPVGHLARFLRTFSEGVGVKVRDDLSATKAGVVLSACAFGRLLQSVAHL